MAIKYSDYLFCHVSLSKEGNNRTATSCGNELEPLMQHIVYYTTVAGPG